MLIYFTFVLTLTTITAEVDYCALKCVRRNQKLSHVACQRNNMCDKPEEDCINFKNTTMVSEERTLILEQHNRLRSMVAVGNANIDVRGIRAANMNELQWDDELEYIALCLVNTCGGSDWGIDSLCFDTTKGESGYNVAFKRISVDTPDLDSPKTLLEHIRGWSSDLHQFTEYSINFFPSNGKFIHFSQIIWAETTHIGCAKSIYGQYITMFACIYRPAGNIKGKSVFKRGAPCSACKAGICGTNYRGLCKMTDDFDNIVVYEQNETERASNLIDHTYNKFTAFIDKTKFTTTKHPPVIDANERSTGILGTPYTVHNSSLVSDTTNPNFIKKPIMIEDSAWSNKYSFIKTYALFFIFVFLNIVL